MSCLTLRASMKAGPSHRRFPGDLPLSHTCLHMKTLMYEIRELREISTVISQGIASVCVKSVTYGLSDKMIVIFNVRL